MSKVIVDKKTARDLRDNINAYLDRTKTTKADLSMAAGLNPTYVSRVSIGTRVPTPDGAKAILEAMRCWPDGIANRNASRLHAQGTTLQTVRDTVGRLESLVEPHNTDAGNRRSGGKVISNARIASEVATYCDRTGTTITALAEASGCNRETVKDIYYRRYRRSRMDNVDALRHTMKLHPDGVHGQHKLREETSAVTETVVAAKQPNRPSFFSRFVSAWRTAMVLHG